MGGKGRGHLDGPQWTQITNPRPHSQEVDETHALCDTLQVAGQGGPEGPWPDSERRPSQGPYSWKLTR